MKACLVFRDWLKQSWLALKLEAIPSEKTVITFLFKWRKRDRERRGLHLLKGINFL
jgi:hypothetical protein